MSVVCHHDSCLMSQGKDCAQEEAQRPESISFWMVMEKETSKDPRTGLDILGSDCLGTGQSTPSDDTLP